MIDTPTPHRSWRPRFSLRAMMVLVAVVSMWAAYQVNWIRQRHEALESGVVEDLKDSLAAEPRAPAGLWLFGERGIASIAVDGGRKSDLPETRKLFPEAKLFKKGVITYVNGAGVPQTTVIYESTDY